MLYKQHQFVGDAIHIGREVQLPKRYRVTGRIYFAKAERIEMTDVWFLKELQRYNKTIAKLDVDVIRKKIEHGQYELEVRRSFGEVNGWSGDHAKLNPPNGTTRKFNAQKISLQEVAHTFDVEFVKLAFGNWDHFMPLAYGVWASFHKEAIRLARKFKEKGSPKGFRSGLSPDGTTPAVIFDLEENELAQALFLEAYGCHFLEDCFASGHLRTPRLLFGQNPLVAKRSMDMHGEDNKRRLASLSKAGKNFRLIGEDDKRDDFGKLESGKADDDMKTLLNEVVETVAIAVQQVLDAAYVTDAQARVNFNAVKERLPRIQVSWRELGKERSRSHALEIWPVAKTKSPSPLYKIHANYNPSLKTFEDPLLIKRTKEGSWRRVFLGDDLEAFTPGKRLAWWIPSDPNQKTLLP